METGPEQMPIDRSPQGQKQTWLSLILHEGQASPEEIEDFFAGCAQSFRPVTAEESGWCYKVTMTTL